jgi:ribulose-phosphate 3-epimerase
VEAVRKRTRLPLDCHLMIVEPERYVGDFVAAGADFVTVHAEATPHLQRVLAQIREAGAKAGVALNPATPPDVLAYVLDDVDLVLVMSVNPGFGGQKFIPSAYAKIKDIKRMLGARPVELSVDGGVKRDHVRPLAEAGATVLVAGSAVFGAPDPAAVVRQMKELGAL